MEVTCLSADQLVSSVSSAALSESMYFSSLRSGRHANLMIRQRWANASSALTGLVCRVIVLHQEGVTVVPDLLAGVRVVVGDQRLQRRVKDALSHDYVDGWLTVASRHGNRLLPHGMNWRRERKGRREGEENVREDFTCKEKNDCTYFPCCAQLLSAFSHSPFLKEQTNVSN